MPRDLPPSSVLAVPEVHGDELDSVPSLQHSSDHSLLQVRFE